MNILFEHLEGGELVLRVVLLTAFFFVFVTLILMYLSYKTQREDCAPISTETAIFSELENNQVSIKRTRAKQKINLYKKILVICFSIIFSIILFFINREKYHRVQNRIQEKIRLDNHNN